MSLTRRSFLQSTFAIFLCATFVPEADIVADNVSGNVKIEWYGDPDKRSYRVSCEKIQSLGYRAKYEAEDGVREICEALESGKLEKTTKTITLDWYEQLEKWHKIIHQVELYEGILEIADHPR